MTATADATPASEPAEKKGRRGTRQVIEWLLLIVAALALALLIKTFLFQAFYIPSESMVPTLETNDRVLVNKLSYDLHDVNRGDVVVFKAPDGADDGIKDLVKRVIGLPGDTLEFREGRVWVNGAPLEEDYLEPGTITSPTCDVPATVTVPTNSVWVMGDNRNASKDSRCFGAVPEGDIVGRVFFKMWPLNDLGFL